MRARGWRPRARASSSSRFSTGSSTGSATRTRRRAAGAAAPRRTSTALALRARVPRSARCHDRVVIYAADQSALLDRARRAAARLPSRPAARPADRRRATGCGPTPSGRDRGRQRRRAQPLIVAAAAGCHEHRRGRSACRARRRLPRRRRVAARRRGVRRLRGADRARPAAAWPGSSCADSVTLDPHKWLYQPIECGCLLVREGSCSSTPSRSRPTTSRTRARGEVNFGDLGLQLTRARAGAEDLALVQTASASPRSARRSTARSTWPLVADGTSHDRTTLELLIAPSLGIICFRRRFDGVADEPARAPQRRAGQRLRGHRPGPAFVHPPSRDLRDPAVRDEPHQRSSRRDGRASVVPPPHHGLPRPRTPTSGSSRTATPTSAVAGRRSASSTPPRSQPSRCSPSSRTERSTSCSAPPASLRWERARHWCTAGRAPASST